MQILINYKLKSVQSGLGNLKERKLNMRAATGNMDNFNKRLQVELCFLFCCCLFACLFFLQNILGFRASQVSWTAWSWRPFPTLVILWFKNRDPVGPSGCHFQELISQGWLPSRPCIFFKDSSSNMTFSEMLNHYFCLHGKLENVRTFTSYHFG